MASRSNPTDLYPLDTAGMGPRTHVAGREVELDATASAAYSPLESLGRRVGLARSNSLQTKSFQRGPRHPPSPPRPSPPSRRPTDPQTYSSPLVFNTFRNSRASSFTSSLYSTGDEDASAYWAGPDGSGSSLLPSDEEELSEGERTERGDRSDEDDLEENLTEVGHQTPPGGEEEDRRGADVERSRSSVISFTTSVRLSRFLEDSYAVEPSRVTPPSAVAQHVYPPFAHLNVGDVLPSVSASPAPSLSTLELPEPTCSRPRAGSVGARGHAVDVRSVAQSMYGQQGLVPPQADFELSITATQRPTINNFSRPRLPSSTSAEAQTTPMLPRPTRNASLRRPLAEVKIHPSPLVGTPEKIQSFKFALGSGPGMIPFPVQDSPPPSVGQRSPFPPEVLVAASPRPVDSSRPSPPPPNPLTKVLLPSQNQNLLQESLVPSSSRLPPSESSFRNPRLPQPLRVEERRPSAEALPDRRPPPPPKDRPSFAGQSEGKVMKVRIPSGSSKSSVVEKPLPPPAQALSHPPPNPSPQSQPKVTQQLPHSLRKKDDNHSVHPGSYSIYSLPMTDVSPTYASEGHYAKVEVKTPTPSPTFAPPAPVTPPTSSGHVERTLTAQQYLELGLRYFAEKSTDSLAVAAMYFRRAASERGGCSGGMLFYGLALRSGWGVVKNERQGFEWLKKASDFTTPTGDPSTGETAQPAVVGSEMVVAILEVARCFQHGWGCKKDSDKALSYFLVGARLGDEEAMLAAARCLEARKRKQDAAFWYRSAAAVSPGTSVPAWAYKKKYLRSRPYT